MIVLQSGHTLSSTQTILFTLTVMMVVLFALWLGSRLRKS